MSKASEYAKAMKKAIGKIRTVSKDFYSFGSQLPSIRASVDADGNLSIDEVNLYCQEFVSLDSMRIDAEVAVNLARWILDTFGEPNVESE